MTIHLIGDSHSKYGWGNNDNFRFHYLGPILCYSIGRDKLKRLNILNFDLKSNDTLIFCFGEIDCRCHIFKYVSIHNTYEMIINNIVNNYIDTILENLKLINFNLKVCIYNVVPPANKNLNKENKEYPFLGSNEDRKNYVLYFNKKLKEKCIQNNFIFFDVYDKYTDNDGFLNNDFSDGHVHITNGIFINDFLQKNIILNYNAN